MAIPFVQSIDMTDFQILNFVIHSAGTSPTNSGNAGGMAWWDSTNYAVKIYNDNAAAWRPLPQAPTTTTDGNIPVYSGTIGAFLGTGYNVLTSVGTPGVDTALVTDQAVREAIDAAIAGGVNYQGGYNAATNTPDLEAGTGVLKGYMYTVTAAGDFFTDTLAIGDVLIAENDAPTTLAEWTIVAREWDETFLELGDTPASFSGSGGYMVMVNSTPDALEFVNPATYALSNFSNDLSLSDFTNDLADLTQGANGGIATFTYDGSAAETVELDFTNLTNETTLAAADEFAFNDDGVGMRALTYTALLTALNADLSFTNLNSGSGITIDGSNNIDLGGSLDAITSIAASTYNFEITATDSANTSSKIYINTSAAYLQSWSSGTWSGAMQSSVAAYSNTSNSQAWMEVYDGSGNLTSITFDSAQEAYVTDEIHTTGLVYAADYSTNGITYGARWIPDKGYVDAYVGGQSTNALVTSPGAGQDGYAIVWDNGAGEYTLDTFASGATSFVGLTDTPANYTSSAGFFLQVNATPDAIVFTEDLIVNNGAYLRSGNTAADVLYIGAYDVDGVSETAFITLTSNNTPTCDLSTSVTIGTNAIAYDGGAFHDGFSDYVGNEHVDHTSVTITAGSGLSYSSGGTDISTSATIDLDINELTGESAIVDADTFPFYDATATANRKITYAQLVTALEGDLAISDVATVVSGDLATGATPTITHNLNKTEFTDIVVQIWRQSDNKLVGVEIAAATADTVTVSFGSAALNPTLGTYRYVVTGVQE